MIKKFKDFNLNESSSKPRKRWPTDIKAVSLVNLIDWMSDKHGIDLREVDPKDRNTDLIHDFFFKKCDKVLFPKIPLNSLPEYKTDARYRHFIFGESIFEIPESFDTSNDFADSIEKRASFKARMRDLLKHKYRTDSEWDKYEKDLDKHVNFGADSFEWVNPVLKLIHDDFKQCQRKAAGLDAAGHGLRVGAEGPVSIRQAARDGRGRQPFSQGWRLFLFGSGEIF